MDIMETGYKMLGATGTQYLNPDYIQPLPTTLDSKNSPLALLAQTCSSIGKDSGSTGSSSSKLSLPSLGSDKKDSHHKDSIKDSAYKQRPSSDSPAGGTSGVAAGGGSRTSSQGQGSDGRTSNRSSDKASAKDCSTSRSSSGGGGGGGECSPKSSRGHSLRPLSSLVSLGSRSGKSTPSSSNAFAVTSGSSGIHRDYSSSTRGSGSSALSVVGSSCSSLVNNNNNNKTGSGEANNSLLYPDNGYQDDIQKSSGGLASSLLQAPHNLQEALRLQHEGLQSLQSAGLAPLPSSYPPLLFGHPLAAIDPLMYSYSASLAAVHGLAMTSHKLPALSPYVGYARVSTASGGSTLVPVCKDPYCATGSMPHPPPHHSLHSGHTLPLSAASAGTPCAAGCTQCATGGGNGGGPDKSHQCTPTSMSTGLGGQFSSLYPSLSLAAAAAAAAAAGGLGANPLLGMAAAAHLGVGLTPYACSWLSGGEFCGKRFSKADDLLQHLRTHASTGEPTLPAFALPGVPLSASGFGGGSGTGGAGLPFTIPGSLSPSSILQQAGQPYPRSLSPTSLLAASRYHPYKSPFATVLPTTSAGSGAAGVLSAGTVSALDAYYSSPYALYGHRIGAATVGP